MQQLPGFSGSSCQYPLPPCRRRESTTGPHLERFGPGGWPNLDRDYGELSAKRWDCRHSGGASSVPRRRRSDSPTIGNLMERRKTRGILLLGSALWCLMIVAAPLLHAQPIYQFFSIICHQIPSRSWVLAGSPLPVCIRCTCIYLGFFIGAVFSIRPR